MRVCGDYGLHLTQNLSVGELAKHSHTYTTAPTAFKQIDTSSNDCIKPNDTGTCKISSMTTSSTGNNTYHNNVSPGIAVYAWHRTA